MIAEFDTFGVEYAFVCDFVRREDSGKLIAIGIYSGEIQMSDFPGHIGLALVIRMVPITQTSTRMEVRCLLDGAIQSGFTTEFTMASLDPELVNTPTLPVAIPHAGIIEWQMREHEDSEWQSIHKIKVRRQPGSSSLSPTASQQPS